MVFEDIKKKNIYIYIYILASPDVSALNVK